MIHKVGCYPFIALIISLVKVKRIYKGFPCVHARRKKATVESSLTVILVTSQAGLPA